jgi:hypothetical protein
MARLTLKLLMIMISSLLVCGAFTIQSGSVFAKPSTTRNGPSFSCAGRLTETEAAICSDPALSAYDRAMAWAFARGWLPLFGKSGGQAQWLAQRNACAGRNSCIVAVYHSWISQLDFEKAPSYNFQRTGSVNNHGEDLMLGSLQSPTGSVKRLGDWGELFVQPIDSDWFLFRVFVTHSYDPHDGLGSNVSTGDVTGLVRLTKGSGTWSSDIESPDSCSVRLIRISLDRWRIIEGGLCSGLGATLTGNYLRMKGLNAGCGNTPLNPPAPGSNQSPQNSPPPPHPD